jgi:hypothetical protein
MARNRSIKPAPQATPADATQTAQENVNPLAFAPGDSAPYSNEAETSDATQAQETAPQVPKAQALNFRLDGRTSKTLAGERLYAHTMAFLELSGGMTGAEMPHLVTVVGSSALAYHKKNNRIETGAKGGPKLTDEGIAYFAARKIVPALRDTYRNAMDTGEIPEELSKFPMLKIGA